MCSIFLGYKDKFSEMVLFAFNLMPHLRLYFRNMGCILILFLSIISMSASAQNSGKFLGFNMGQTKLYINKNFEGKSDSLGAAGVGLSFGYLFAFNLVTKLNTTYSKNFSLFGAADRYSLQHLDFSVGYKNEFGKLSMIPMIGYSNSKLISKEGQLFNSGIEEVKNDSGDNFLWGLSMGYAFHPQCELHLSYKKINTGFGGYQFSYVEVLFNF